MAAAYCGSADDNGGQDDGSSVQLEQELSTLGNAVTLPSTGDFAVQGVVVDDDRDGSADGLDLTGNAQSDLVYLSGALSKASPVIRALNIAFYLRGDGGQTAYYLVSDGSSVGISLTSGGAPGVRIAVSGGAITGLDTDGDGAADVGQEFIGGLIPGFVSIGTGLSQSCLGGTWTATQASGSDYTVTFNGDHTYEFLTHDPDNAFGNYFTVEQGEFQIVGDALRFTPLEVGSGETLADAEQALDDATLGRLIVSAGCEGDRLAFTFNSGTYGVKISGASGQLPGVYINRRQADLGGDGFFFPITAVAKTLTFDESHYTVKTVESSLSDITGMPLNPPESETTYEYYAYSYNESTGALTSTQCTDGSFGNCSGDVTEENLEILNTGMIVGTPSYQKQ